MDLDLLPLPAKVSDNAKQSSATRCKPVRKKPCKHDPKQPGNKRGATPNVTGGSRKRSAASAFMEQLVAGAAAHPAKTHRALTARGSDCAGPLKVGSDCTGLATEALALHLLGIPTKTLFVSEVDETKINLLSAMHSMVGSDKYRLFKNIHNRDPTHTPFVDLYISGAPCPAWSSAGLSRGLDDPRGVTILHCLRYVKEKKPTCVVLENVRGLLFKKNEHVVNAITDILVGLQYKVWHRVLNTREHGVPHNRPRVYFVAVQRCAYKNSFNWT